MMKSRFLVFVLSFLAGCVVGGLACFFYFSSLNERGALEAVESYGVGGEAEWVGREGAGAGVEGFVSGADILAVKEPRLRGGGFLRPFFEKWGELDGPAAYASAIELKGRNRSDGISAALAGWAHTDVHGAWEIALELIEESSRSESQLARGVVSKMARQDPDVLLKLYAEDSLNQKYSSFGYSLIDEALEAGRQSELLPKLGLIERDEMRNRLVNPLFWKWGMLDYAFDNQDDPVV